jgi:hypothetical protein
MSPFERQMCGIFLVFLIFFAIVGLPIWYSRRRARFPLSEKLIRSPGESLSRKLETLTERITIWISALALIASSITFLSTKFSDLEYLICFVLLSLPCCIALAILTKKSRNYNLGLMGERAVGEELNQLMRDGCFVFHDYPGGDNWNIDHIVVSPAGVFAVETKTRRKRRVIKGRMDHEVIFDGKLLHFPHGTDSFGLEQARRNAASLARDLSNATGEPVLVKPVLTFPGWFVTLKGKGDVHVLNPRQIRSIVTARTSHPLSTAQIQRIVHQIDQKCRDVTL